MLLPCGDTVLVSGGAGPAITPHSMGADAARRPLLARRGSMGARHVSGSSTISARMGCPPSDTRAPAVAPTEHARCLSICRRANLQSSTTTTAESQCCLFTFTPCESCSVHDVVDCPTEPARARRAPPALTMPPCHHASALTARRPHARLHSLAAHLHAACTVSRKKQLHAALALARGARRPAAQPIMASDIRT
jgi:hypothetical protein